MYILVFLCVVLGIYLYTLNSSYNTRSAANYATPQNNMERNNNTWYGLNAAGTYRGYGREYAGHLSPGRIYGNGNNNANK